MCQTLESHLMLMVCLKMDSSLCPAETFRFMQTGHQADSLDLCPSLDVPAKQNKLSHNCLFQELCESLCFDCLLCWERMPKLKETYLQIRERNAREIRQRTREKVRALQGDQELVVVEDLPAVPIVVAQQSYLVPFLVCLIIILVLVNLLLWQFTLLSRQV